MIVWGGCGLWILLCREVGLRLFWDAAFFPEQRANNRGGVFFANGQEFVKYAQNSHFDL
jgi:hypothetical protein